MDVAGHMLLRMSLNRPEIHLEVNPFNVCFSLLADFHLIPSALCQKRTLMPQLYKWKSKAENKTLEIRLYNCRFKQLFIQ